MIFGHMSDETELRIQLPTKIITSFPVGDIVFLLWNLE